MLSLELSLTVYGRHQWQTDRLRGYVRAGDAAITAQIYTNFRSIKQIPCCSADKPASLFRIKTLVWPLLFFKSISFVISIFNFAVSLLLAAKVLEQLYFHWSISLARRISTPLLRTASHFIIFGTSTLRPGNYGSSSAGAGSLRRRSILAQITLDSSRHSALVWFSFADPACETILNAASVQIAANEGPLLSTDIFHFEITSLTLDNGGDSQFLPSARRFWFFY